MRASRGVVVSSGEVQSPQLLILSGISPADHLRSLGIELQQDLPVGQNLWDYLALPIIWHCTQPVSLDKAENLANILRYLLTRRVPFVSNIAEAGAFLRTRSEAPRPTCSFTLGRPSLATTASTARRAFFTIGPTLVAPQGWGLLH